MKLDRYWTELQQRSDAELAARLQREQHDTARLAEAGAEYVHRPRTDRSGIRRTSGYWLDGVWLGPTSRTARLALDGAS